MENPSNIQPDQIIVLEGDAGLVPKASSGDVGKVLGVLNSSGDVGWVPDQEGMAQVQADWDQSDSSQVSYIANKPDLSVYATTSAMETALADKQNVISDLSDIRAGAALGATAAQPSDLPSSDELLPSATSGDSGKVLTVGNDGTASWVTPSAGTVYTPGDGVDITNNVISADVDGTTIGIDSTTKKIKSLQTIPTKTSDLQNDSNFVVASSLATVATSGSYADLSNKPTIPSVDQSYNAASSNAQSGTAVAGAIAGVKQVPSSTSADENKVLTVNSSGNPVWENSAVPASKPLVAGANITITDGANNVTIAATDTTYTAGDGIDITSGVVSADVDGTTIGIDASTKKIKLLSTIPTVDQHYSASSTNAQSGTAVAEALGSSSTLAAGNGVSLTESSGTLTVAADVDNVTIGFDSTTHKIKSLQTVDQTYSAVSTNAQSGVAVAQAIAAIPAPSVDEVPAVTSSDDGKVLKASYSGGQGSYAWGTETGTTYTAGDAIDITNNEISVDYDTNTLDVVGQTITENVTQQSSSDLFLLPSSVAALLSQQDDTQVTVHIPANTLRFSGIDLASESSLLFRFTLYATDSTSETNVSLFSTPLAWENYDYEYALIEEQDIVINFPASVANQWTQSLSSAVSFSICLKKDNLPTWTEYPVEMFGNLSTNPITFTFVDASVTKLAVKNPLPASAQADSGKVLKVNASGNAEWGTDGFTTTAGVTDIQVVNALPASPVATVLYLIPET